MTSQDDGTTESAPQVPSTSNSSEISSAGPTPEQLDAATRRFAALEQVGQHSADLMVVIDQSGAVLYANPTAAETLGISLEEGLGTNAFKYLHPDDEQRVILQFLDIVATPGISIRDTIRTLTEAGETRVLEIVSTNSIDNTAVGGIIVNGHDITDQQKYVTQLQEYEDLTLVSRTVLSVT